MSEIFERVARAIDKAMSEQMDPTPGYLARAAIKAMRDPTENMLFVGSNEDAGFTARNLRTSWELMIDEALSPGVPPAKGE